ncbi:MAG: DsrE family protein [Gemmatimonadota bacterium]|nr:DsrE family protein [Gemmatimonadota bacterium]
MHALIRHVLLATLLFVAPATTSGQDSAEAGPTIDSGGAVFPVSPTLETPTELDYRVAFDVADGSGPEQVSVSLNTVARFLNMHARAGVPAEGIDAAIVIHGTAVMDVLNASAYHRREGTRNPNAPLIRELLDAGTRIIVCGQSAASRGVDSTEFIEGVDVALSAMTAFVILQSEGYRVNPW